MEPNEATRRRTERLFWLRSQDVLRNTHNKPGAGTMSVLWGLCAADATLEAAREHAALAGVVGAVANKAGPVRLSVSEHKTAPLFLAEFKAAGVDVDVDASPTAGTVDGYLAVFNNTDLVRDVIEPGAFSATLHDAEGFRRAHGGAALYPLLWQHDKQDPIGYIASATQDRNGLRIKGVLDLTIEHGRQAYDGLRDGYLSFSIGYKPVKYQWKGSVRHLTELALAEGSVVTFPANPEARATRAV